MGTKVNPAANDCYARAMPDEPMFVLLARDPLFKEIVELWAQRRQYAVECGDRPNTDSSVVAEAFTLAMYGAKWRRNNMGKWREKPAEKPAE